MSYVSPIKIGYEAEPEEGWTDKIGRYIAGEVDNLVLESCVKVGCHVDKDELEKALRYDRDQYVKGYEDGKRDAAAEIEALEAEVKRLKDSNDELREKQTFIDNWGTRWSTSAKDVPDSAYKHGYADGKYEALTLEKCIDRLHELGWLQEHDRILSQPHWVSVEERLPNVDEKVLVFAVGKLDVFVGDTVIALTSMSDTNWLNHHEKVDKPYWLDPWQYFLTDYRITHWMPLPEPPKEDA